MTDPWSTPERLALRALARDVTAREVAPHMASWEAGGMLPRSLHEVFADCGLLGVGFPESVGGSGGDAIDAAIVWEEVLAGGGSTGLMASLYTHGIALPHLVSAGSTDLIHRYVRPTLAGALIGCLGVTEPGGGSDVAGLRTSAVRDGGSWVINGSKTYITSGIRADFVTLAVRTRQDRYGGISLIVVDKGTPGVIVSQPLEKMGWRCSDTAELAFDGVRVPVTQLIGEEGAGFRYIMEQFQAELLALAVQAYATAQRCLDLTLGWVRDRETFGRPLASRQVVRHKIAQMARATWDREGGDAVGLRVLAVGRRGRGARSVDGQEPGLRGLRPRRRPGGAAVRRARLHARERGRAALPRRSASCGSASTSTCGCAWWPRPWSSRSRPAWRTCWSELGQVVGVGLGGLGVRRSTVALALEDVFDLEVLGGA